MSSKLIFVDIDGTLTPAGSNTPPESAMEAIRAAQAAGNKVFLCTGRNMKMLEPVLAYGFDGVVASGGGYVMLGDEVLFDCPMTPAQQEKALRLFAESGVLRTIEAKDDSYCDEGFAELLGKSSGGNSELMRWREAIEKDLGIRPMREYDGRPIYKVVFMYTSPEQLEPALRELEAEFDFVIQDIPGSGCLNGELVNRRFDKGSGIRRIAEACGVPLSDTYGFGDSMNDLKMIETVGTSVCMADGSPALKEISDIICPGVAEDGLAWAFRELHLAESTKADR